MNKNILLFGRGREETNDSGGCVDCPTVEGEYLLMDNNLLNVARVRLGFDSPTPAKGDKIYFSTGDTGVTNSPRVGQSVLSYANYSKINPSIDRYTNFFKGSHFYPTDQKANSQIEFFGNRTWTDNDVRAFFPQDGADHIHHAAFVYACTGDESYVSGVKQELLWYSSQPGLDFSNRSVYTTDPKYSVFNFALFLEAKFLGKLLLCYDYTKGSSSWSTSEKVQVETFLKNVADFYIEMYDNQFRGYYQDYDNNNFRVTAGFRLGTFGSSYDGDPYPNNYGISEDFSNRTSDGILYVAMCAFFFNIHSYKDWTWKMFRLSINFHTDRNSLIQDVRRARDNNDWGEENAYRYMQITAGMYSDIAYIAALKGDFSYMNYDTSNDNIMQQNLGNSFYAKLNGSKNVLSVIKASCRLLDASSTGYNNGNGLFSLGRRIDSRWNFPWLSGNSYYTMETAASFALLYYSARGTSQQKADAAYCKSIIERTHPNLFYGSQFPPDNRAHGPGFYVWTYSPSSTKGGSLGGSTSGAYGGGHNLVPYHMIIAGSIPDESNPFTI